MRALALLFLLSLSACDASAVATAPSAPSAGALSVDQAWAGVMPGGTDVGAGYLSITNAGAADRLLSASSPRARMVMLHDMHMEGSVMIMRTAEEGFVVPAHGTLRLSPSGSHLMFMGVTEPFVAGQQVPVTLTFEHAGALTIALPVGKHGH